MNKLSIAKSLNNRYATQPDSKNEESYSRKCACGSRTLGGTKCQQCQSNSGDSKTNLGFGSARFARKLDNSRTNKIAFEPIGKAHNSASDSVSRSALVRHLDQDLSRIPTHSTGSGNQAGAATLNVLSEANKLHFTYPGYARQAVNVNNLEAANQRSDESSNLTASCGTDRFNSTRSAAGSSSGEEELTQGIDTGQLPGLNTPNQIPADTLFSPSGQCYVDSGPTYTPSGTIPVTNTGGRKSASFSMAATFGTALVTVPPREPSCCQVRQYIKWNEAYQNWRGGPPHSGFPSSATFGTWYEDRDSNDKRYGHRSGPHSDPISGCGDEYLKNGVRDQANGDSYCGRDNPQSSAPSGATYNFQLKVIDTCNGGAEKASSSIITVNW